ncbi:MAG TPA: rhodanese-like domain-containing protein [bacterium]|nr:rhodanese-like domain-containing protein [bacterium]
MHMSKLKIAAMSNSARMLIIFIASIVFTIMVNAFLPSKLPLLLTGGKRPGIPVGAKNELRYTNARKAFETVSAGHGILIDIRDSDDYDKSHAAGAINIPYHDFEEACYDFAEDVSTERNLFILCHGKLCGMSVRVANRLLDLGFKNLKIIKQDYEYWKNSNLPIEENILKGDQHGTDE